MGRHAANAGFLRAIAKTENASHVTGLVSQQGIRVDELESSFPLEHRSAIRRGLVWMVKMHILKFPMEN